MENDSRAGQNVLIIGAGPSGKDIALEIEKYANRVTLSHHRDLGGLNFLSNVKQQGDISAFTENGVIFTNGEEETFTHVLFCTGNVTFSFPFSFSYNLKIFTEKTLF